MGASPHAQDGVAQPTNVGSGVVRGVVSYAPTALPAVGALCRAVSFSLALEGADVAGNTVISGYVGPLTVTGAGVGPCDSMTLGEGTLDLRVTGRNPDTGSEVECPTVSGRYARVLSDLSLQLFGSCTVNRYGTGVVLLTGRLEFVPNGVGAGVLTSVSTATVTGAFAVVPN